MNILLQIFTLISWMFGAAVISSILVLAVIGADYIYTEIKAHLTNNRQEPEHEDFYENVYYRDYNDAYDSI